MNIGDTLGSFRITARLGSGGMGEVFLGEQESIDTKVAIKVLRHEISKDQEHVKRFFNEARAVGKIKHAGTVKIFEGGFHPSGRAYLIMEFLDGESLAARIQRSGWLALGAVCDLGRQIASVLSATHAVGITHRDLKPDNIFIVADAELASGERVKILDFGIAKLTGATLAGGPQTIGTMGTPAYMAPEQWGNSASVDWRADAYSLGCVLFEMVCGRPPFTGASFADLCAKHLSAQPPTPGSLGFPIPAGVEQLIMRLLVKNADERSTPLADVMRDLEAIGRHTPSAMAATVPPDVAAPSTGEVATTFVTSSTPVVVPPAVTPPAIARRVPPPAAPKMDVWPARVDAPPRNMDGASTTMRGAAGEAHKRRGKRGGVIVAVASVVLGGSIVGVALKLRAAKPTGPQPPPPPAIDAVSAEIDAAIATPATPTWRAKVESTNPFVTINGVTLQRHQVTEAELGMYLATLSDAARANAQPLLGHHAGPKASASGLSYERARAFCLALGADLPTVAQWTQAASGAWGIDGGDGMGPLQEWTATLDTGLVTVVGGHDDMTPAERTQATLEPMQKQTETSAGPVAPDVIADVHVGFRCVR